MGTEIEGYASRHAMHLEGPILNSDRRSLVDRWRHTACGHLLLDAHVTRTHALVSCGNCRRTREFRRSEFERAVAEVGSVVLELAKVVL